MLSTASQIQVLAFIQAEVILELLFTRGNSDEYAILQEITLSDLLKAAMDSSKHNFQSIVYWNTDKLLLN